MRYTRMLKQNLIQKAVNMHEMEAKVEGWKCRSKHSSVAPLDGAPLLWHPINNEIIDL